MYVDKPLFGHFKLGIPELDHILRGVRKALHQLLENHIMAVVSFIILRRSNGFQRIGPLLVQSELQSL